MAEGIALKRWMAKKASRAAMAAFSSTADVFRADDRGVARALTYHRFGHIPRDPFCLAPEVFEQQMRWLADQGLAVSLEQLERFARGEQSLPSNAVLVTIDDGYLSTLECALPILKRYGVPAVAFVSAGLIGSAWNRQVDPEPFMTWQQLARLPEAGIEVGCHGHTHRSLGKLSETELASEVQQAREALQARFGSGVGSFAYPFGTRADFNDRTEALLRASGFTSVFTSQHGAVTSGENPWALPRVKVESGEALWMFRAICRGAMDRWRIVDELLWRTQQIRYQPGSGAAA